MTKPTTTGSDNSDEVDVAKLAVEQADSDWDNDEDDDSPSATTKTEPEATEGQTADDDDSDNLDSSTDDSDDESEGEEESEEEDTESEDEEEESEEDTTPIDFDKDLDKWIEKRLGRKPENDQERTEYQRLRNSQRDFTRSRQTTDLDKALNEQQPEDKVKTDNPLEDKLTNLERQLESERNLRIRGEFLLTNNVKDDEIKAMGEILKEKLDNTPQEERQAVYNFLTSPTNLKSLHSEAKASLVNSESRKAEIDKAKKEERQRVAKTSQASPSARSAKQRVLQKEKTEQEKLEELWDEDDD